jgi:uncharacterized protein YecE (DUF72 family)
VFKPPRPIDLTRPEPALRTQAGTARENLLRFDASGFTFGANLRSIATMRLSIGTSGYSYAAWKGKFYPERLPAKQMLGFYAERFPTVEINNTFYRMPTPSVMEAWAAQVPAAFRFAIKAPRRITHERRLANVNEDVARFLDVTSTLAARRGPLLFQLPPNFQRDDERLGDFLALLPAKVSVAFEFRHASWFDAAVYEMLSRHRCALAVTESDEATATPVAATADFGYARLRRTEYTDAALHDWLARLRDLNCSDTHVYFKHEDDARGPEFASRLRALAGDSPASSPQ